jgi:RNA polymerase sigma-70 factor (ECF subfamily)
VWRNGVSTNGSGNAMRLARQHAVTDVGDGPSDELADADLVRLAQDAPRAFAPLYLRYLDRVLAYCAYRLADRREAEDAASAIFLKALHGLPGYRHRDGTFRSWLFRIAHNEVADRVRYRARHRQSPLDGLVDAASPERAPDERAVARDRQDRILVLLGSLPPRERAVLELRAADLATHEIASILGITEQNARTAQCRAVARMRELAAETGLIDREVRRG